jgi:hypothetical protein
MKSIERISNAVRANCAISRNASTRYATNADYEDVYTAKALMARFMMLNHYSIDQAKDEVNSGDKEWEEVTAKMRRGSESTNEEDVRFRVKVKLVDNYLRIN